MPVEITMPQLSDTMTEGTVVKWRKKEGDKVRPNEAVAEVETDKATMEMEVYDPGTLAHIVAREGQKVPVGGLIAVLATGKEDPAAVKKQYAGGNAATGGTKPAQAAPPQQQQPAKQSTAGGARVPPPAPHGGAVATMEGASLGEMHEPDEVGHHATRERAHAVPPLPHKGEQGNGNGEGGRVSASPLARRIAADKGVDLRQVQGSGPGGRIVQADVLSFLEQPQDARSRQRQPSQSAAEAAGQAPARPEAPALPQRVARGKTEVIPLTKMRATIAQRLQQSKQTIPHFYVTNDVDVEDVMSLRQRLNKQLEPEGVKLSLNDFVSRAACMALMRHPAVNAHWTNDGITRFGDVHLGFAVSVPDGLMVPVIRGADQMGLKELQQRTSELAKKARATPPVLKRDEMGGETFTISNLGMYGVREFSAIINPPAVAILAVSGAEKRAVVKGEQVVARTVMSLTLSVDHRAVDGATAAEFMRTLKGMLEEPGMMLV